MKKIIAITIIAIFLIGMTGIITAKRGKIMKDNPNKDIKLKRADKYLADKCVKSKFKHKRMCKNRKWISINDVSGKFIDRATDKDHYAINISDANTGDNYILFTRKANIDRVSLI